MERGSIYILIILFLASITIQKGFAQSNEFKSEKELIKVTNKLFSKGKYEEAMPLFSQLKSVNPSEPLYDYKLGICMLYVMPEKYVQMLEFAANKTDIKKEVHFYLGRAYHLNYRFNDAIKSYNKYIELVGVKEIEQLKVGQ